MGRGRPDTLPFVTRALGVYADVTELWTVGEPPKGLEPDRHIPSPNTQRPHQNVAGHLRRVCEQVDGPFMWCDDDTFLLKPWRKGVYVRPFSMAYMLRHNQNRGYWSHAVRTSMKIMQAWGFDPDKVPCGTTHRPWMVEPERAMMTLEALDKAGGGSFKALYVCGMDGLIEAEDYKIVGAGTIKPSADVVSLFNNSWTSNAGRIIREMFDVPSQWESEPTPDTDTQSGGRVAAGRRRRI